ncbi:hypothetical protein Lser_V15G40938 [Lactuca serriola]
MKSLVSNAFGLMKQNRKGMFMYEGKFLLVKFGQFTEVSDATEFEESFDDEETKDEVITTLEHQGECVPSVAIIDEEHVPMVNGEGDDDDDDDDEENMDLVGDLSGYDNDDLFFGIKQSHDIRLRREDLDAFFDNVNDVAQTPMETKGLDDVIKATPLVSTHFSITK